MQFFNLIRKPTTKLGADSVRNFLTNSSPMLIILCFICCLFLLGIIKFNYQVALFNVINPNVSFWVSLLFALVVQIGRMAFGFVGVRDLSRGRWIIGLLGLTASAGITYFEHTEVERMVAHWNNQSLHEPLLFLVWGAFLFELRLIGTMVGEDDAEKEYQKKVEKAKAEQEKYLSDARAQIKKELELQFKQRQLQERVLDLERREKELTRARGKKSLPKKEGNGQLNGVHP